MQMSASARDCEQGKQNPCPKVCLVGRPHAVHWMRPVKRISSRDPRCGFRWCSRSCPRAPTSRRSGSSPPARPAARASSAGSRSRWSARRTPFRAGEVMMTGSGHAAMLAGLPGHSSGNPPLLPACRPPLRAAAGRMDIRMIGCRDAQPDLDLLFHRGIRGGRRPLARRPYRGVAGDGRVRLRHGQDRLRDRPGPDRGDVPVAGHHANRREGRRGRSAGPPVPRPCCGASSRAYRWPPCFGEHRHEHGGQHAGLDNAATPLG